MHISPLHPWSTYHIFICLQSNLKDISLFRLGQKEEHGLGLMGGRAHKNHSSFRVIQVILARPNIYTNILEIGTSYSRIQNFNTQVYIFVCVLTYKY